MSTAKATTECSRSESEAATAGQQFLGAPEAPAPAAALELAIGPAERGGDTKEHDSAEAEGAAAAGVEHAGAADEGAVVVVDAAAAAAVGATTAAAEALLVSPGDRVSSRGDRLRLYSISKSNLLKDAYASRVNQITRAVACFFTFSTLLYVRCTHSQFSNAKLCSRMQTLKQKHPEQ